MDKRIIKSTQKIKETYLELLFKEEPNRIQVIDLCKEAKVNRSTFYDRYGFLDVLENEVIEEEMKKISFNDVQIDALPKEASGIDKSIIKKYIEAFCNNKILLRFCMVENREKYVDIIAHKQIDLCANSLTKVSYYSAYFQCIGALATLIEWVNDPKGQTIDDIINIVYDHSVALFGN